MKALHFPRNPRGVAEYSPNDVIVSRPRPVFPITFLLLLLCFLGSPPQLGAVSGHPFEVYNVHGLGRTTGDIIGLTLVNSTDEEQRMVIGPVVVPPTGSYQGYVIFERQPFDLAPGESRDVVVRGYCTDISREPIPAGEPATPFDTWIFEPPPAFGLLPGNYPRPEHEFTYINPDELEPGELPPLLFPGTDVPFPFQIDHNAHPRDAAPFLLAAAAEIDSAYDRLRRAGRIHTPFSQDPLREREAVIQQAIWITAAALKGERYEKEQFVERLAAQLGTEPEDMPEPQREVFEQGSDDFWDSFNLTGAEAKVLHDDEHEPVEPVSVAEDFPEPVEARPEPVEPSTPPVAAEAEPDLPVEPTPPAEPVEPYCCCTTIRESGDGDLAFGANGLTVTLNGHSISISVNGQTQTWNDVGLDVEAAFCGLEEQRVTSHLTSVSEQVIRDGEVVERQSTTDIALTGPDSNINPYGSSYGLSFSARTTGPDGELRETSVYVGISKETCEIGISVHHNGETYGALAAPFTHLSTLKGAFGHGPLHAGPFPGEREWWNHMHSVMLNLLTWMHWLRENPDQEKWRELGPLFPMWINHAREAVGQMLDGAEEYGLTDEEVQMLEDFLEMLEDGAASQQARFLAFNNLVNHFGGAGKGPVR